MLSNGENFFKPTLSQLREWNSEEAPFETDGFPLIKVKRVAGRIRWFLLEEMTRPGVLERLETQSEIRRRSQHSSQNSSHGTRQVGSVDQPQPDKILAAIRNGFTAVGYASLSSDTCDV